MGLDSPNRHTCNEEFLLQIKLDVILEKNRDLPLVNGATHMNALVRAARGEALVRLPVNVECWRGVEGELLLMLPCMRVPYNGRAVDARALQRKLTQYRIYCEYPKKLLHFAIATL